MSISTGPHLGTADIHLVTLVQCEAFTDVFRTTNKTSVTSTASKFISQTHDTREQQKLEMGLRQQ